MYAECAELVRRVRESTPCRLSAFCSFCVLVPFVAIPGKGPAPEFCKRLILASACASLELTGTCCRRLRGSIPIGDVSHGLTPTAKCCRGFAALSEVKTRLGRRMLIQMSISRASARVSKQPPRRRQHLAVGVSPWTTCSLRVEPRRRRQQSSLVVDLRQVSFPGLTRYRKFLYSVLALA